LLTTGERIELPDGDFVDLAWSDPPRAGPLVVVLHGLEGGLTSPYVRRLFAVLNDRGWGACLLQFRGCSGTPNRLARSYHSGDTGDFAWVIARLRARFPARPLAAVGYSIGGNVLLRWLGQTGPGAPLVSAVAVSVPFDLAAAASRLDRGFSKVYQAHLLGSLRRKMAAKLGRFELPFNAAGLAAARTFWRYDDCVTAPLHGFRDAADYYARASSRYCLQDVAVPTLVLHARDDPFLPASALPRPAACSPAITWEVHARGGHVGFVTDPLPGLTCPWLEGRVAHHLAELWPR